jgi:peroxiredoxin
MKKFFVLLISTCLLQAASAQLRKGQEAPPITLPNTQDSMISLASFKGKVVLLDFWASWCGPCRRSNPKLVKLYKEFKNQGFEIVAISLDQGKMAWLDAIKQDGLPYTQLIDSRGSKSEVADSYGIYQIPTQFLIDKEGKLQEKDLGGKQLRSAIQQLLKK